ncbi:hypothetical protein G6L14_10445 [Agrobacterium vitis]|uniref:hypothetical protein n=1 Tax=Agrobacterium vitis TaxID=373 RepID=UPI001574AF8A|nr:hypothetical protein [Agrobacterium vitis]NSY12434.1 hypothetical protein [Agrobacterium vitis]
MNPESASGQAPLSSGFAKRIDYLRQLLSPMSVKEGVMVRLGRDYDGGYVMLDHNISEATAYSIGISDDVSWDLAMANRGCRIFQYDHTISELPGLHPNFTWSKQGLACQKSATKKMRSLQQMVRDNGHLGVRNLLLKCDAEGAEWAAIQTTPTSILTRFSQIILEIHSLEMISVDDFYFAAVRMLRKLNRTHQLVHIHGNNCGLLVTAAETWIPSAMELTYVRKKDHAFEACAHSFPTDLDMPCTPHRPDIFLGKWGRKRSLWAQLQLDANKLAKLLPALRPT